jgi:hypothetical protein
MKYAMAIGAAVALLLLCPAPFLVPVSAEGHPGGLDANGCHTNHTTGEYHCHRGDGARPSRAIQAISGTVYYRNCTQARAAGAAPIYAGQPGYAAHLDRDGDGVACEPYRAR